MVAVVTSGMFAAKTWAWQASQASDLEASIARGKTIYNTQCVTCHREKGEGIKDVYPPLAKSDYLMAEQGAVDRHCSQWRYRGNYREWREI